MRRFTNERDRRVETLLSLARRFLLSENSFRWKFINSDVEHLSTPSYGVPWST